MPRTLHSTRVSGIGQSDAPSLPSTELLYMSVFMTPLGVWGCAGDDRGLRSTTIGNGSETEARTRLLGQLDEDSTDVRSIVDNEADWPGWFAGAVESLLRTARSEQVDLSEIPLHYPATTPLRRNIWDATRRIPWGRTVTYGQLAELAGVPRGARTVGQAMSHNRLPIVIPCHRVLGACEKLTGFSAPRGLELKRDLLRQEGAL
jgi:methylated-DNA-[protein]-cysteine S-methyltransferase